LKKLSIFISHPSNVLTDNKLNGDGLAAFEFIKRLAAKGHTLHVAFITADIEKPLPSNVHLYQIRPRFPIFAAFKATEYMIRVRWLFKSIQSHSKIDLIHQLNPVEQGLSFGIANAAVPLILGLYLPGWNSFAVAKPRTSLSQSVISTISALTQPWIEWCDLQQQKAAAALLLSTPAALTSIHEPERNQNKIHYLSYGIDLNIFYPDDHKNVKVSKEPSILYLARLSEQKGIFILLEAFEQVATVIPSCRLTIAGSGEELERVKQRIAEMSCADRIDLIGRVERDRVAEVMRQCNVYCLPSDGEPFGISALEAMACGKPVVATNAGGLAYLVPDLGGRKVSPGDAKALAEALIEILSSPKLQQDMGEFNRSLVEENYSWEQIIEKLESIYNKFVEM
jgi:L-malate glycosyltransferase